MRQHFRVAAAAMVGLFLALPARAQDTAHKPGGLNKMAREVSKASKKAGSNLKSEKNKLKSSAHGAATETGKSIKDTTLKSKP